MVDTSRLRTSQSSKNLKEVIQAIKKQQCKGPEITVAYSRISRGQDARVRRREVKDEVGKELDFMF